MTMGLVPVKIGGKLFNPTQVRRIINNTLKARAKDFTIDYKVTTQTWKTKPKFVTKKISDFEYTVTTDSLIYLFVSGGTRPHIIRAKNAPALAFNVNFTPKTRVKVIGSGKGASSPPVARPKEVKHPGTEAREFTETIIEKWEPLMAGIFERALQSELHT